MEPKNFLVHDEHIPQRAKFPVVDAHNHLWGNVPVKKLIEVMDAMGVVNYCDLTGNYKLTWGEDGGMDIEIREFKQFVTDYAKPHPGRFYAFTTATFAAPSDVPLFTDAGDFVSRTIDTLDEHVAMGARGLKILKTLGLLFRDGNEEIIGVDDPRLSPIWEHAGKLGIPVLMHQSDPAGLHVPPGPDNEHNELLTRFPEWGFYGPEFPTKETILNQRDTLVGRHRNTTFILAHVANYPENLGYVSQLLDENPNVNIDFSARMDELGRQPYSARELFIKFQDQILFGTDMPGTPEMYRCYFRFLETFDEEFYVPFYDGTFGSHRWGICGIGLEDNVLEKIYNKNALRIIPHLQEDFDSVLTGK